MPVVNNKYTRIQEEATKPKKWESYLPEDQVKYHMNRIKRWFKTFISNAHMEINDTTGKYKRTGMYATGDWYGLTEHALSSLILMEVTLDESIQKIENEITRQKLIVKCDKTLTDLKIKLVEKINKDEKILNNNQIKKGINMYINYNTSWPLKVKIDYIPDYYSNKYDDIADLIATDDLSIGTIDISLVLRLMIDHLPDTKQLYYDWIINPHYYKHLFSSVQETFLKDIIIQMMLIGTMRRQDIQINSGKRSILYAIHFKRANELLRELALLMIEEKERWPQTFKFRLLTEC